MGTSAIAVQPGPLTNKAAVALLAAAVIGGSIALYVAWSPSMLGASSTPENAGSPLSRKAPIIPDVPKDAIPPLDFPRYETAAEAQWLRDEDWIVGYAEGGDARAYPIRIMNWHEIVNERIAGRPILVSYCPLCFSGIVFDRRLDGRELSFGNTGALYESDLVMYDRESMSYWWQVAGLAIKGPLEGRRLTVLPSTTTTWEKWRELYPQTLVLSRDTGHVRDYSRDIFASYQRGGGPAFPVSIASDLLPAKTRVIGVEVGAQARAYPVEGQMPRVINNVLNEQPLLVIIDAKGGLALAYDRQVEGQILTFELRGNRLFDRETNTEWSLRGEAVLGQLAGRQLAPFPSVFTFWFAWYAAHPDTTLGPGA